MTSHSALFPFNKIGLYCYNYLFGINAEQFLATGFTHFWSAQTVEGQMFEGHLSLRGLRLATQHCQDVRQVEHQRSLNKLAFKSNAAIIHTSKLWNQ